MQKYTLERDGQVDFFSTFLPRVNPGLKVEDIVADNNDGVLNGNLLEFKLHVGDLGAVLFQCIKYLSAMRIKGRPVPANILIVDLNASMAWKFNSGTYLGAIEVPYTGAASKGNSGFIAGDADEKIDYASPTGAERMVAVLKECNYTRINIDENCIVGWAEAFYRAVPTARKEDFLGDDTGKHSVIGEIRAPVHLAKYILPYKGKSNVKFSYLMDKLNDTLQKKNLGAFYTHPLYAEKSLELVRAAIARVPDGNDYVIIDRCAGTGNLEAAMTDEELSHCIVSTVEYYEYKVLQELLGAKVRHMIPPTETSETFDAGLVNGADALSREYVESPLIRQYVDNPKCTIILFENPPYAETTSIEHQVRGRGRASSVWKGSFVAKAMSDDIKGTATNDLGNAFIWSAFKFYLRQPTDSYVVYSPAKYWKAQHLINRKFLRGFAFNRRHFHTNIDACIMVALWSNESDTSDCVWMRAYDISHEAMRLVDAGELPVRTVSLKYSQRYYDKRPIPGVYREGIMVGLNGREKMDGCRRNKPACGGNIIGYMVSHSSGFDNPDLDSSLLVAARYDGNGFFLRRDAYLDKLPMFAASRYITYNRGWTERGRIMKSADGADRFFRDVNNGKLKQFLLKCLLFTCVEMQNHMRTFKGSDGRFYRNELCLDDTNGETLAIKDLKALKSGPKENTILSQWDAVLKWAKTAKAYNDTLTYGVYQIADELDTSHKDEATGKTVYDNVELHTALKRLKELVKEYYNSELVPVLFEYEFLK